VVPPCSDRISRVPPYSRIFDTLRIRGYHPLWPHFPERSAYLSKTTGLFRVRSPLLAESLLMSFPPGTEMFQFPGFASYHYGFIIRYPCGWVAPFGYPRINACSRLPVAFRSVPRPSSPPGAKASTECPSYTRYPRRRSSDRHPPCTETILRISCQFSVVASELHAIRLGCQKQTAVETANCLTTVLEISTPHTTGFSRIIPSAGRLRDPPKKTNSTKSFTTSLNPRRQPLGRCPHRQQFPGQTIRPNNGSVLRGHSSAASPKTAAGEQTHQSPDTRAQRRTRT
jgi:hypothetical protein